MQQDWVERSVLESLMEGQVLNYYFFQSKDNTPNLQIAGIGIFGSEVLNEICRRGHVKVGAVNTLSISTAEIDLVLPATYGRTVLISPARADDLVFTGTERDILLQALGCNGGLSIVVMDEGQTNEALAAALSTFIRCSGRTAVVFAPSKIMSDKHGLQKIGAHLFLSHYNQRMIGGDTKLYCADVTDTCDTIDAIIRSLRLQSYEPLDISDLIHYFHKLRIGAIATCLGYGTACIERAMAASILGENARNMQSKQIFLHIDAPRGCNTRRLDEQIRSFLHQLPYETRNIVFSCSLDDAWPDTCRITVIAPQSTIDTRHLNMGYRALISQFEDEIDRRVEQNRFALEKIKVWFCRKR